jgi:hypothetical protein
MSQGLDDQRSVKGGGGGDDDAVKVFSVKDFPIVPHARDPEGLQGALRLFRSDCRRNEFDPIYPPKSGNEDLAGVPSSANEPNPKDILSPNAPPRGPERFSSV